MDDNPCTPDCQERSATCHTTCERYLKRFAQKRELYESQLKARLSERDLDDYVAGEQLKNKKLKPTWKRKK